jgi:acetyltransferase
MTVRNLSFMFQPGSIALIGAAREPSSVTSVVGRNLINAGFAGELVLVPSEGDTVEGFASYRCIAGLPKPPDLAVITAPLETVPGIIGELGRIGTKAAVVITPGCEQGGKESGARTYAAMLDAAQPHLLRIVGPGSLGVMVPGARLNAGFADVRPVPGNIAFVAQSGAVLTAVLDWATARNIGFSQLVALGDMIDVDFGDLLDYLTGDSGTQAILLYMEAITQPRKFMSAARAAARVKPVIVLKGGRHPEGSRASRCHTGRPAGADAVYDAAFRRAGMLRVADIEELFDAVETLATTRQAGGARLAILTNGGGIGVLAADSLMDAGGCLAALSSGSMARLNGLLPTSWSHGNPVDIGGDAPAGRYADALEVLLEDNGVDAVLVLNCPNAVRSGEESARAVIDRIRQCLLKGRGKPVFTSWLGDRSTAAVRRLFAENRIPGYDTPGAAVRGFMQVVRYRRSQDLLMQTPPSIPESFTPDVKKARAIVDGALAEDRSDLTGPEVKAVFAAYDIAVTETLREASAEESPVASRRGQVRELSLGMFEDPQFGPVLFCGHGASSAEDIRNRALALPPLNLHLAREVTNRSRVDAPRETCRDMPAADPDAIAFTLVKLSQLVCDIDEIREIEINPLRTDEEGVVALNGSIKVTRTTLNGPQRLAIRPYPKELEELLTLPDGCRMRLRPIRPEDEPAFHKLFANLTAEEVLLRFLNPMKALPHTLAARLTQIDYDREMALVLEGKNPAGESELYGSVRIMADPDNDRAEFAILLRGDMTGSGLGPMLLRRISRRIRHPAARRHDRLGAGPDAAQAHCRLCPKPQARGNLRGSAE